MELFNYSVVIRTLGTAGKKYQALLDSITKQNIQPAEVIVVIPNGYDLPKEKLGYERFVRSPKGMVIQRTIGLKEAKSEYCLFVDDDICFSENYIEKLAEPIIQKKASVTFPIFDMLPKKKYTQFIMAVLGTALPFERKDSYTTIIRSGGYSYNPRTIFQGWYYAQTAPGACFFCARKTMLGINFDDEKWLEYTEYALPDDQVMFYKFHLLGFKIIGVGGLDFIHLDASVNSASRSEKANFAMSCNKTIFWHRFIWKTDPRLISRIYSLFCFIYSAFACFIYGCVKALFKRNFVLVKCSLKGYKQAYKFLQSKEYKHLPPIK